MTFKITLRDILLNSVVSIRKKDSYEVYRDSDLEYQLKFILKDIYPDFSSDKISDLMSEEITKIEKFYTEHINTYKINKFPEGLYYGLGEFGLCIDTSYNPLLKNLILYKERDNQTNMFG